MDPTIVGFCAVEVKPFGPVQAYVAPATKGVVSRIDAPEQIGVDIVVVGLAGVALTEAGASGKGFTTIATAVLDALLQPVVLFIAPA